MTQQRPSLVELEDTGAFARRHIGPGAGEQAEMLAALGLPTLDALIERTMPGTIATDSGLDTGDGCTEAEMLAELRGLAAKNQVVKSFIGLGYYGTHTPAVVLRNVLENPSWYTSYTPYQAEVAQGRLEALLNFQTMVADLTAMDIANASLLDEPTAAAEAMAMSHRLTREKTHRYFVDADVHPQTLAVIRTRAEPLGIEVVTGDPEQLDTEGLFGALLSYPGSSGRIRDFSDVIERVRAAGGIVSMTTDLLALTLLAPPGQLGADIVVGSAQRFGVPFGFGGPHAGFMATHEAHKRAMPGRLVGVSIDPKGRPGLRLALQTREQHIRREKATSNVCTAQALLAIMAGFYATYHGPEGLTRIAQRTHRLTGMLAAGLRQAGFELTSERFFDTLTVAAPGQADALIEAALQAGYNLRRVDADHLGISLDETATRDDVAALLTACGAPPDLAALDAAAEDALPAELRRTGPILTHPVFHQYRSETEMMRYMKRLGDKDIALDRSMIPLGSCTMKLNAAAEMIPITWPEFGQIHPFAPLDQARGYLELIDQLERYLVTITGYAAVSLQPNAGSQGEYAGLLAIRGYHRSRGEGQRDVCLIPSSAHGTNPASASMAGMRVVVVGCDDDGNIDLADLKAKAEQHGDVLGALMVTYPSTHGVFEEQIAEACKIIHDHGGQVYMDGANLNAMVGLAKPGEFGSDVSHLNLHKTFCIPHGGGGPGVGPIGVGAHLAPFLPNHPLTPQAGPETGIGLISGAPWGSAGILPISWAYIRMMGRAGLTEATKVAILNANYMAKRLGDHYPVLYTGRDGLVAHECIIDVRPLKDSAGVSVDDIAKRLMDYGFHAPTMSWPVAGTLMIEPTESESKAELDRFCDAMIQIREEVRRIEAGTWPADDNPLVNAPHTAEDVSADDWPHPYSRAEAAYPLAELRHAKFWPPVGRVDNVHGDRNLVCSCPPLEAYAEAAE